MGPLQVVFTAGVPASGKTCALRAISVAWPSITMLDMDNEMIGHPLYQRGDPQAVYALATAREWARRRVDAGLHRALAERVPGRLIAVDGTGRNAERRQQLMLAAREAGYLVHLVHVRVTNLTTALARNRMRERRVPERLFREYARAVASAVAASSSAADKVWVVVNDGPGPGCRRPTAAASR